MNPFTVIDRQHRWRPDIGIFVNGLPLCVIDLKNAADEDATIWSVYAQVQTPMLSLEVQKEVVAEIEGHSKEIERLKGVITSQEKNIQKAIARAWCEDSESANGVPSSQPGATPQKPSPQNP